MFFNSNYSTASQWIRQTTQRRRHRNFLTLLILRRVFGVIVFDHENQYRRMTKQFKIPQIIQYNAKKSLLYPTQRVAESRMILTRP